MTKNDRPSLILCLIFLILYTFFYLLTLTSGAQSLTAQDIISSREVKNDNIIDDKTGEALPLGDLILYLYKTQKPLIDYAGEDKTLRTENRRVVLMSDNGKVKRFRAFVYSGDLFYQDEKTGSWFYTGTESATPEAFESIPVSPISRLFNVALAESTTTYSGSGDGMLGGNDSQWVNIVNWTSAEYVAGLTSDIADQWLRLRQSGGSYYIQNPFLPFDIPSFPGGSVIDSVSLFIYTDTACTTYDEDGTDLVVVAGDPVDPSSLSVSDWATRGSTAFAQKDLTDYIHDGWVETPFNTSGKESIIPGQWNTFALRTALDLEDIAPLYRNDICFYFSEAGANAPYLAIDYTIEEEPPGPSATSTLALDQAFRLYFQIFGDYIPVIVSLVFALLIVFELYYLMTMR